MKAATVLLSLLALLHSAQPQVQNGTVNLPQLRTIVAELIQTLRNEETRAANSIEPATDVPHLVALKVQRFLRSTPYIKSIGFTAKEMLLMVEEFRVLTGQTSSGDAAMRKLFRDVRSLAPPGEILFPPCSDAKDMSDAPLPVLEHARCCPFPNIVCKKSRYRTIDGSCNCKSNVNMGRSNRALARLLPPDYDDGLETPRMTSVNGKPLPSARKVSNAIFNAMPDKLNNVLTQGHFSVGQFIDHDSDRVPISTLVDSDGNLVDVECGPDGCQTTGIGNDECFPIDIPDNDPFHQNGLNCLIFVRSQPFPKDDCPIGPREQANALTSWLDASMLYGSNFEELQRLREFSPNRGRMAMIDNPLQPHCGTLLPLGEDPACRGLTGVIRCFLAGDERVNEQVGLTAMHTVFMRLHNFFENKLFNVFYANGLLENGEMVFQETRKLVIAVWQNIIYHEYLPLTIGQKNMDKFGLTLKKKCFKGYDCKKFNVDVTNVFATAAYRFGHSQIGNNLWLSNPQFTKRNPIRFSNVFFRPKQIYKPDLPGDSTTCGADAILLGLTSNQADTVDRFFTQQLTRHLFTENPPYGVGFDLPALNIQRGRDHGIPSYVKWRKFCKLSVPIGFNYLEDIPANARARLASVYNDVRDMDLFPGGIAEKVVNGGTVGPTFACIIANRFKSAKFADKFFFERCDKKNKMGYSKDIIKNIKKYTFGRLLCDTLDDVQTIQRFPMMLPLSEAKQKLNHMSEGQLKQMFPLYKESSNERMKCKYLPTINFKLWRHPNQGK